jgi:hypothetical protein
MGAKGPWSIKLLVAALVVVTLLNNVLVISMLVLIGSSGTLKEDIHDYILNGKVLSTPVTAPQQQQQIQIQQKEGEAAPTTTTKEAVTQQQQPQQQHPPQNHHRPIRYLLGIQSMLNSTFETRRREVIRSTYLNYYVKTKQKPNRICSLQDMLSHKIQSPEACQIIYTFFVGANPKAPPEQLQGSVRERTVPAKDAELLLLQLQQQYDVDQNTNNTTTTRRRETDLTLMNVRENMADGKTSSWLNYGAVVNEEENLGIDYIVKVDSDTMLIPERFLAWGRDNLRPSEERVYGGYPYDLHYCQDCENETLLVGDVFMLGRMYFVSTDLGKFIGSDEMKETREKVRVPGKGDITISNFVYSHPQPIRTVSMEEAENAIVWHPLKNELAFIHKWERFGIGKDWKQWLRQHKGDE